MKPIKQLLSLNLNTERGPLSPREPNGRNSRTRLSALLRSLNRSADLLIGSVPNLMCNEPIWRSALRRVQGFTARTSVRRIQTLAARFALLALTSAFSLQPSALPAQGTAFTYQGRLDHSGNPAQGSYDLRFAVYNAVSGPSQVGPTLTNAAARDEFRLNTFPPDHHTPPAPPMPPPPAPSAK